MRERFSFGIKTKSRKCFWLKWNAWAYELEQSNDLLFEVLAEHLERLRQIERWRESEWEDCIALCLLKRKDKFFKRRVRAKTREEEGEEEILLHGFTYINEGE